MKLSAKKKEQQLKRIYDQISEGFGINQNYWTVGKFQNSEGYFLIGEDGFGSMFKLFKICRTDCPIFKEMSKEFVRTHAKEIQTNLRNDGTIFESWYSNRVIIEGVVFE